MINGLHIDIIELVDNIELFCICFYIIGTACSSVEVPVMGMERRGWII
jgi:hypothetical protein